MGKGIFCSCHATWLPCKTSIAQILSLDFRRMFIETFPQRARTGKNNRFPFLDILGYLKNTHKKSQIWKSEGFLWVFFKYPKISKNGNPLFFPVSEKNHRKVQHNPRRELLQSIRACLVALLTKSVREMCSVPHNNFCRTLDLVGINATEIDATV